MNWIKYLRYEKLPFKVEDASLFSYSCCFVGQLEDEEALKALPLIPAPSENRAQKQLQTPKSQRSVRLLCNTPLLFNF